MNTKVENLNADVVVIGAGGAGLTAAIMAKRTGAQDIILLEKAAEPGGDTKISHSMFAVDSPAQKRQGINISADKLFIERMEAAQWKVDPKLSRDLIRNSGLIMQWLEDRGIVCNHFSGLGLNEDAFVTDDWKTFHDFDLPKDSERGIGKNTVEALVKECEELGIKILCNTPAKKILTDGRGRVEGVKAEASGKELNITAKSVILATGGFSKNKELMERFFPRFGFINDISVASLTGDGLIMAEEIGAAADTEISISARVAYVASKSTSIGTLIRLPEVVWVNKKGECFIGSSMMGTGNAIAQQPGKVGYALLDSVMLQDIIQNNKASAVKQVEERGEGVVWTDVVEKELEKDTMGAGVKIADTWDEIAGFIGAKPEVLNATIERYNSFCEKGYDEDFLKDKEYLKPLRKPPFYAIQGGLVFDNTLGGIKINHKMEIIDNNGDSIAGLYGVGDLTGGFLTTAYMYHGQAMTFAFYSGYVAGQNAAKYVSASKGDKN